MTDTYGSKLGKLKYTTPKATIEDKNMSPRIMKDLVLLSSRLSSWNLCFSLVKSFESEINKSTCWLNFCLKSSVLLFLMITFSHSLPGKQNIHPSYYQITSQICQTDYLISWILPFIAFHKKTLPCPALRRSFVTPTLRHGGDFPFSIGGNVPMHSQS